MEFATFSCWLFRGESKTQIFPESALLHFGSLEADTATLSGLPEGTVQPGDTLSITEDSALGYSIFVGKVDRIETSRTQTACNLQTVVFANFWRDLERMTFRQIWAIPFSGIPSAQDYSSHIVLNQHQDGKPKSLRASLDEILSYYRTAARAARAQNFAAALMDIPAATLPFDECRDITCAEAIRRILRLFPRVVSVAQYGDFPGTNWEPWLQFRSTGFSGDFQELGAMTEIARTTERTISAVWLEVETVTEFEGGSYRNIQHQEAGTDPNPASPDTFCCSIQRAGTSVSQVRQSYDAITEDLPEDLEDKNWWKSKHPRLANIPIGSITISGAARAGKTALPRIAGNPAGDLHKLSEEGGFAIQCAVEQFTCTCTIATEKSVEEEIFLTMDFLMTNAETKTYRWTQSLETVTAETIPDNLAAAILADRSGSVSSKSLSIPLDIDNTLNLFSYGLPLGCVSDGCVCTAIDLDLGAKTATASFGRPAFRSPDEMLDLLTCFRGKARSRSCWSRATGDLSSDCTDQIDHGGIQPLSSTEFAPGQKCLDTITKEDGTVGQIKLDSRELKPSETVELHTLIYPTANESGNASVDKSAKILSSEDIRIKFIPDNIPVSKLTDSATHTVVSDITLGEEPNTLVIHRANLQIINAAALENKVIKLDWTPDETA